MASSGWACASCTLRNEAKATKCTACDTKKPVGAPGFTMRFRLPALMFSSPIPNVMKFGALKTMLEGKSGIPARALRMTWSFPEKEAVGEDSALVSAVFGIKPTDREIITVHVEATEDAEEDPPPRATAGPPGGARVESKGKAATAGAGAGAGASPKKEEKKKARAEGEEEEEEGWGDDGDDEGKEEEDFGDGGGDDWGEAEFDDKDDIEVEKKVAAPPPLVRQSSYTVLTKDALGRMQQDLIDEIDEALGVSFSEAGVLLRKYRWKKDRLFSDWVNNPAKVRREAGLAETKAVEVKFAGTAECPYCMSEVTAETSYALTCNHRFCLGCWTQWLTAEMEKGPQAIFTCCPNYGCQEIVPEDAFLRLVATEKKKMLQGWLIRSFIDGLAGVKWCPGAGCERAVAYPEGGERDIDCGCGTRWCFNCREEAHQPAPCYAVAQWVAKNKSDKDNLEWLIANTKPCPRCKTHIEKNNGCNHMTCRNCKHEFCWLCKGDWSAHGSSTGGYYKCNTYDASKDKGIFDKETKAVDEAKNSLQKYQFYFQRYQDHGRAATFAIKTIQQTEEKMEGLQERLGGDIRSVDFLLNAVKAVVECRRNLKWSYAFGYYLPDNSPQKRLFETDQGMLEKFSDHLHELIEKPIDSLLSETARKEVISYTAATYKYLMAISDAVMAGNYSPEGSAVKSKGTAAPPPMVAAPPGAKKAPKLERAPSAKRPSGKQAPKRST